MADAQMIDETGSTGEVAPEGDALPERPKSPTTSADKWRSRIAASVRYRETKLRGEWQENVNYRVQRPYGADVGDSTRDKLSVPEDWSRTKQKTAQLMFNVPKIVATAGRPELEPLAPTVTAAVNDVLRTECQASYPIDECLSDVINAAGVMAAAVGIDQRYEQMEVPGPQIMTSPAGYNEQTGQLVPAAMRPGDPQKVDVLVSQKFTLDRISPALLLWPPEFRQSDWDKAPWLGYETWMAKPQVARTWSLTEDQAARMQTSAPPTELLSKDIDDKTQEYDTVDYVKVTIIWARGAEFDETIVHPECFKRVVFVDGISDPVEDDKTDWQEWVPEQPSQPAGPPGPDGQPSPAKPAIPSHYNGITKNPIRVATLTYVSDIAVPPSDSEAGRSQVREMIRGRSQMLRQRDHSIPLRWYDVNRLDEEVADSLRAGTWQDMIPMNGPGTGAIGEVARASYPRENFEFQSIVSRDLDRSWALSNNQLGSSQSGRRSAKEIETIQSSTDIRLDYEKARVSRFVVGIAEVLFGLMQRFLTQPRFVQIVGEQGATILTKVDKSLLAGSFAFDFLADSSDRVDIGTKLQNAIKIYNLMANSPGINRVALEKEIVELHGFDPAKIVVKPPPPKDEPPNVTYRFSGEDLLNPMAAALLLKTGQINQQDILAAARMIQDAMKQIQTLQALKPAAPGGAQPAGPPRPDVEPPTPAEPILKRLGDGSRML
jgi:hypothetical protein